MNGGVSAVIGSYGRVGVLVLFLAYAVPAYADEAEWLVAPYAWISDVSYDQNVDDGSGGEISGRDLIDKSDTAGMIRIEAAKGRWGAMVDYLWLSLSDRARVNIPPSAVPNASVVAELDLSIVEFGGFYRPSGDDSGIDVLFGIRTISTDSTLLLIPDVGANDRLDGDKDYTDGFVGARYLHRFNETWDASLRADVSFGDTEGSVNALASVGYRFGETFALQLGYRYTSFEFDDIFTGAGATTDVDLSGPLIGAVFRF